MKIYTPPSTVTFSVSEIEEIVAQHVQDSLPAGHRFGNLIDADLGTMQPREGLRVRLAGNLTFELFSKEAP